MTKRPANPKMRRAGLVLLGLAALSLIGAITGWQARGGRAILVVAGVFLLLLGTLLLRTRTPGIQGVHADSTGLRVDLVGGASESIPWDCIGAMRVTRLSSVGAVPALNRPLVQKPGVLPEGYVLTFTYTAGAPRARRLRAFERGDRVLIGLPADAVTQVANAAPERLRT